MQNALKLAKQSKKGKFSVIETISMPEEISAMKVKLTDHECQVIEMLKRAADQNGEWKDISEKHLDSIDDLYDMVISENYIREYLEFEKDDKKCDNHEKKDEKRDEKKKKRSDEIREKNT